MAYGKGCGHSGNVHIPCGGVEIVCIHRNGEQNGTETGSHDWEHATPFLVQQERQRLIHHPVSVSVCVWGGVVLRVGGDLSTQV